VKYQITGINFYENWKDAGQADGTGKPHTAFLLSRALRPLRLDIPHGKRKTSFQREIPSTLSTGAGDEIPGFPPWPEQRESALRFPIIRVKKKANVRWLGENYENWWNYRNCFCGSGDCSDLRAHGSNSFFFGGLISSQTLFGSPLGDGQGRGGDWQGSNLKIRDPIFIGKSLIEFTMKIDSCFFRNGFWSGSRSRSKI
jgi:hypothetical protein